MSITEDRTVAQGRRSKHGGRQETAARLLASSARKSYDPTVEVDWEAPIDDSLYGMTPEWCSLYGTEMWESMTQEQRVTLSKHEAASISSTGIWFEMCLMQMILRDVYWQRYDSNHVMFGLAEIADECRHSTMFARAFQKFGIPNYKPNKAIMWLGAFFKSTSTGSLAYGGTLFAEEILDMMQRDFMKDDRVQPITRSVSKIHVTEEARHIRFAREETIRKAAELGRVQRAYARLLMGGTAYFVVKTLVHKDAYKAAGLDPKEARKVAANNPHHQSMIRNGCAGTVQFLDSVGLVGGPSKFLLKRANIV
ncbi:diiron oxygenase [Rhodococcus sp. D2-41]|uniref:Diiron oxygenase n=1 Tax=Speluncibacter jeojiensis TaxID=2710754 RepID=A0A9X4M1L9_9ACTN|nr:diiron oxygenase [Rhodococcus sp. D2-41]MDG3009964.1 diiron oxygenase [Rhodococcus sp. D2-41]MDG3016335.1 diiron oxygenase [Corynebacteriales bacterium D3-21]